jgi:hypothetical protein
MHETSLGGTVRDYLTGEERERATYEDLRQALARLLVEERGYAKNRLAPRYQVPYRVKDREFRREADIAVLDAGGAPLLFLVFCPGQIGSYVREVTALARLVRPRPCPLAVVTDMRDAELFAVRKGLVLASGLHALPVRDELEPLAAANAFPPLSDEQRDREGRILHAYTGFLKNCCGEKCVL